LSRSPIFLALLLPALAAVAFVLLATRFGIGITPDSTVYLEAARNLLEGRGLIALAANGELQPMTHYPPLYSSLIALTGLMPVSVEAAARWLQALLFAANVLVVGLAIARYARASFWLPLAGALLMLTAPDVAAIHTLALTEALFVLLAPGTLLTLARFLETNRYSWLITAASFAALALLTRYAGGALIITGIAAVLLAPKREWRRRLGPAVAFGAIACLPMLLWTIRNLSLTGDETDRQMSFHPRGLQQIIVAFSTISSWLLAGKVRADLRIGVFAAEVLLLGLFLLYLVKQKRKSLSATGVSEKSSDDRSPRQLFLVLAIFIVSYAGFTLIATTFLDLVIFDDRTLVPVHVVSIMLAVVGGSRLLTRFRDTPLIRIALTVMVIALVGSYSYRTAGWFDRTRHDGQGYASRSWRNSETIHRVQSLPPGTPIYSNAYDAVYYLTGRRAISIPVKTIFNTGQANRNYEAELDRMELVLREQKGVLVYFNTLPERWHLPAENELRTRLSLVEIASGSDGSVWGIASSK
jgi:hypothetical protein